MDFTSILTNLNPLMGGGLGVIGTVVTSIFNYKQKKADQKNALMLKKLELEQIGKEKDRDIAIMQARTTGAVDLADAEAYKESQKGASMGSGIGIMIDKLAGIKKADGSTPILVRLLLPIAVFLLAGSEMLKGLMRPIITVYYVMLSTYITAIAWQIVQAQEKFITAGQAMDIVFQVINTVMFLTVTCVTWWFGDRMTMKYLTEKYK